MADERPTSSRKRRWWRRPHAGASDVVTASGPGLPTGSRPNFRRGLITGALAIICLAAGDNLGGVKRHDEYKWVAFGLAIAFFLLGVSAVRSIGRDIWWITRLRAGADAATAIRVIWSAIGYVLILFGVLKLLGVNLASLLVGGAVAGAIVGIVTQQSLSNYFAGLLLLFTKPFSVGDRVKIRSGGLGGPFVGTIVDAGLVYTIILTDEGLVSLPNAGVLNAAIGPAPEDEVPEDEVPANNAPSPQDGTDAAADAQAAG